MALPRFSRCIICNKPFRLSKGASAKQRVCSAPECRQEAHRRACARWRKKHPTYDRETRLAKRLVRKTTLADWLREPMAAIDWAQARDDVGLATAVLVEEWAKVFLVWARETVRLQIAEAKRLSHEGPFPRAREKVSAKLE
jgi:hypothetical protein